MVSARRVCRSADDLRNSGASRKASVTAPEATSEVSVSDRGSITRRQMRRAGSRCRSTSANAATSSSSPRSSESARASAEAATITCASEAAIRRPAWSSLDLALALAPALALALALAGRAALREAGCDLRVGRPRRRSAIGGALVEIEDLRRAHVRLGLVPGDAADLAHDLRHALGLAQDDVHCAVVHVLGR